ncbi:hypothetical protein HK098_002464 [Nowakowskiella sp. JEL0407]|nr:hypothetical protein HK098_002464 [Nowakowskiella sp. JEL0407]
MSIDEHYWSKQRFTTTDISPTETLFSEIPISESPSASPDFPTYYEPNVSPNIITKKSPSPSALPTPTKTILISAATKLLSTAIRTQTDDSLQNYTMTIHAISPSSTAIPTPIIDDLEPWRLQLIYNRRLASQIGMFIVAAIIIILTALFIWRTRYDLHLRRHNVAQVCICVFALFFLTIPALMVRGWDAQFGNVGVPCIVLLAGNTLSISALAYFLVIRTLIVHHLMNLNMKKVMLSQANAIRSRTSRDDHRLSSQLSTYSEISVNSESALQSDPARRISQEYADLYELSDSMRTSNWKEAFGNVWKLKFKPVIHGDDKTMLAFFSLIMLLSSIYVIVMGYFTWKIYGDVNQTFCPFGYEYALTVLTMVGLILFSPIFLYFMKKKNKYAKTRDNYGIRRTLSFFAISGTICGISVLVWIFFVPSGRKRGEPITRLIWAISDWQVASNLIMFTLVVILPLYKSIRNHQRRKRIASLLRARLRNVSPTNSSASSYVHSDAIVAIERDFTSGNNVAIVAPRRQYTESINVAHSDISEKSEKSDEKVPKIEEIDVDSLEQEASSGWRRWFSFYKPRTKDSSTSSSRMMAGPSNALSNDIFDAFGITPPLPIKPPAEEIEEKIDDDFLKELFHFVINDDEAMECFKYYTTKDFFTVEKTLFYGDWRTLMKLMLSDKTNQPSSSFSIIDSLEPAQPTGFLWKSLGATYPSQLPEQSVPLHLIEEFQRFYDKYIVRTAYLHVPLPNEIVDRIDAEMEEHNLYMTRRETKPHPMSMTNPRQQVYGVWGPLYVAADGKLQGPASPLANAPAVMLLSEAAANAAAAVGTGPKVVALGKNGNGVNGEVNRPKPALLQMPPVGSSNGVGNAYSMQIVQSPTTGVDDLVAIARIPDEPKPLRISVFHKAKEEVLKTLFEQTFIRFLESPEAKKVLRRFRRVKARL